MKPLGAYMCKYAKKLGPRVQESPLGKRGVTGRSRPSLLRPPIWRVFRVYMQEVVHVTVRLWLKFSVISWTKTMNVSILI